MISLEIVYIYVYEYYTYMKIFVTSHFYACLFPPPPQFSHLKKEYVKKHLPHRAVGKTKLKV